MTSKGHSIGIDAAVSAAGSGAEATSLTSGADVAPPSKGEPASPSLEELARLAEDPSDHARLEAAVASGSIGSASLPYLARLAIDPNDYVRLGVAAALTSAGPAAVSILETLIQDPNDYVRLAAKESVYRIAFEHQDLDAVRLGVQEARDPNLWMRKTAWQGLKKLPRELIAAAYAPPAPLPGYEVDCLNRCHVPVTSSPIRCDVCVAFVATPGFEHLLDMCLWSLKKYGELEGLDYTVVAFMPGADDACRQVCRRHHALCIEPIPLVAPHASMKGMAYSLHRWVDARCYLSLEPDMLVVGSLRGMVQEALGDREDRLYAVPSFVSLRDRNLALREHGQWNPDPQALITTYFDGDGDDVQFLLGDDPVDAQVFCNAGLFLGNAEAFRRVEERILAMQPFASLWIDTARVHWRDEMVWNLAYSQAGNIAALPKSYNYEPESQPGLLFYDVDADAHLPVTLPRPARVIHFMGNLKEQMPFYAYAYGFMPMPTDCPCRPT